MQQAIKNPPPSAAEAASLEVSGLAKRLGGQLVVDHIDFRIAKQESVVLLGPSGCGKTTTLRMVAGFIQPDAGEIHLDGALASSASHLTPVEKRKLGMVFQSYAIWPHKTVYQNVAYGLNIAGGSRTSIRERAMEVLGVVKLEAMANRYPGELSGGQQQRVALARAIAVEPSLLLLDEPLSNLDAGLRQEMRYELMKLNRRIGMTCLYVTHDQDEALTLADRIAVMNKGRIEQIDTPFNIYFRPANAFVAGFVGTNNLLRGKVISTDRQRDTVAVRTAFAPVITAAASPEMAARLKPEDAVSIAVRPEDFEVTAASQTLPENAVAATLTQVAFLGNRYELEFDAGTTLRANLHRSQFNEGDRCHLLVKPSNAWVVQ